MGEERQDKPASNGHQQSVEIILDMKDPRLIDRVADLLHTWYVGENKNLKLIFLVVVSKYLPREFRLHVIITGESSAGKSSLAHTVLRPWDGLGIVINLTRFTGPFLERFPDKLDGHILFYEQVRQEAREGAPDPMVDLKFLLSEGKLSLGYVDMSEKDESKRAKQIEVEGIPIFLSTSVKVNLDPEALNRVLLCSIDETKDQSLNVITYQAKQSSRLRANRDAEASAAKTSLKMMTNELNRASASIYDIMIPFAPQIVPIVPTHDVKIRRDFLKIMNLTRVIAFVHHELRRKVVFKDVKEGECVILLADVQDFYEAVEIGGESFKQTMHNLTDKAMRTHKEALRLYDQGHAEGIKVAALANATQYSANRVREIMASLVLAGYWTMEKESRENVYRPTLKQMSDIQLMALQFDEEDFTKWFRDTFPEEVPIPPLPPSYAPYTQPVQMTGIPPVVSSCYPSKHAAGTLDAVVDDKTVESDFRAQSGTDTSESE